jgi:hypothetical protein
MAAFAMLAFRYQRDVWCVVFIAIAVLAESRAEHIAAEAAAEAAVAPGNVGLGKVALGKRESLVLAVAVLVCFVAATVHLPSNAVLQSRLQYVTPTKACDYIRDNHLPTPLFNAYRWGGFLTWYLPEYPVAIDGRLNLYGEDRSSTYFKVWAGTQRMETDPSFMSAQTLLLENNTGFTQALTQIPALREQFHLVYQDDLSAVFVRQ